MVHYNPLNVTLKPKYNVKILQHDNLKQLIKTTVLQLFINIIREVITSQYSPARLHSV